MMIEFVNKINLSYASSCLSGAAFKVLVALREIAIHKKIQCIKKNQCFDGWISVSYESLRQKSGVSHIRRVIQEFESNNEIVEVLKCSGVLSRYKLNDDLLEVVDNEF